MGRCWRLERCWGPAGGASWQVCRRVYFPLTPFTPPLGPCTVPQEGWVEIESLVAPAAKGDGQAADGCQLGWAWLEVLWRRGLQHEHHQASGL